MNALDFNFKKILVLKICLLTMIFTSSTNGQSSKCIQVKDYEELNELYDKVSRHEGDDGKGYADSLLTSLESQGLLDCEVTYWVYFNQGDIYEFYDLMHLAVETYYKVIPVATKNEWHELLAETYISLARALERDGRGIDCKRNLDEAKVIIDKHKLERARARLNMRSSSYFRIYERNPDTAMVLALSAVDLGRKHNHIRAVTDGYMLLGMLETDINKRIEYYREGRDVFAGSKVYHGAAIMNSSIAGLYNELGDYDKALKAIEYSRQLEEQHVENTGLYSPSHFYQLKVIYGIKSQIFQSMGKPDSSRFYRELSEEFSQKVKDNSDEVQVSQIEIKNAVETEKLKTQGFADQLRKSKVGMFYSFIGFLVFAGLGYSVYKNRNEIKAKNELISKQVEELSDLSNKQATLLSEVHHRVKNNLQNIVSLLLLQEMKIKDKETKYYLSDISNKIHSIALIHDQLYREGEFENIQMKAYLEDLIYHYNSVKKGDYEIKSSINTNDISLNLETVIPLGIICAELITNSLKHITDSKEIVIQIDLENLEDVDPSGAYRLHFQDNGPGYPPYMIDGDGRGMGVRLIMSMTRQLLATLNLFNKNGAHAELLFNQKTTSKI